ERVTWLDIEGIPLKVWSKNTFSRITAKWDDEEGSRSDDEGRFDSNSDDNGEMNKGSNLKRDTDIEEVTETIFEKEQPSDNNNGASNSDDILKYPPRCTPNFDTNIQNKPLNEKNKEGDDFAPNDQEDIIKPVVEINSSSNSLTMIQRDRNALLIFKVQEYREMGALFFSFWTKWLSNSDDNGEMNKGSNLKRDTDIEEVAETIFEKEQPSGSMKEDFTGKKRLSFRRPVQYLRIT
nr:nucleotide-binding alpha-beta plait domain-containing protein [Tanacetum cinerariifolium]